MKKLYQLFLAICLGLTATYAQTDPSAFTLSSGNYSFTEWASTSPTGSYPANMRFYTLNTVDPPESASITADYTGSYTLTTGTRINGEDANGVSFINTGSGQLGAAVLALNTTGRKNITVTWTGRTILANVRIYSIQLYYRLDNTGSWTPLNSYIKGTDGSSSTLGPIVLPVAAENKPLVQLQWKYYQDASNGTTTGTRPKLAIDDISVTSEASQATAPPVLTLSPSSLGSFSAITGTSSTVQSFTLSGSNLTANVNVVAPASFAVSLSANSGFGSSVTLVPTGGTLASTPVYIRFSPTTSGQVNGMVNITSGTESKTIPVVGTTVTWPSAFNLSTGPYTFTVWDASSPAGTYPANMRFYNLNNTGDTGPADVIAEDYTIAYNNTTQTRINGQDQNGFSFINTSGSNNANSPTYSFKLGAAVVALNTQGRNAITVSWTGLTFLTNSRAYVIRLYYRVGDTGAFTEVLDGVGNPVQYKTAPGVTSAGSPASSAIDPVTLPAAANNQPLVQVMWKYMLDPENTVNTSNRAQLGVDNITITSTAAPMPVTWVTGARKNGKTATIFWTTYTETHSKSFAVQRSSDAIAFTTLGEIASQANAGNSTAELTYQYTDETPLSGTNYYRIAQKDLDGTTNYSRVYALEFDHLTAVLSLFPNPASSTLNVEVTNTKIKEVSLFDIQGRLLSTKVVNDYGTNLDVQALTQPVFYTQIVLENGEKLTKKVMKK